MYECVNINLPSNKNNQKNDKKKHSRGKKHSFVLGD